MALALPPTALRADDHGIIVLRPLTCMRQRSIEIGAGKRTATVPVYIGKTEDVRTDMSFVDLTVGDPEIADVNPLTDRSLSILGRKSGTTRVSAYAEGKKLIGVFDVEVRLRHLDALPTASAPFPARQAQG